jgi:hypothetical protein
VPIVGGRVGIVAAVKDATGLSNILRGVNGLTAAGNSIPLAGDMMDGDGTNVFGMGEALLLGKMSTLVGVDDTGGALASATTATAEVDADDVLVAETMSGEANAEESMVTLLEPADAISLADLQAIPIDRTAESRPPAEYSNR